MPSSANPNKSWNRRACDQPWSNLRCQCGDFSRPCGAVHCGGTLSISAGLALQLFRCPTFFPALALPVSPLELGTLAIRNRCSLIQASTIVIEWNGVLDEIAGCLGMHETMTTLVIGYDVALPCKLGLYRMLTALVFQEARDTGRLLNLSAGAAQFKRHRVGKAQIEYSAVYVAHLSVFQRAVRAFCLDCCVGWAFEFCGATNFESPEFGRNDTSRGKKHSLWTLTGSRRANPELNNGCWLS